MHPPTPPDVPPEPDSTATAFEAGAFREALAESLSDAVLFVDRERRIRFWNRAAEALYGWTAEEVMGRSAIELFRSEVPGSSRDAALATINTQGEWHGECIQSTKDGRRITVWSASSLCHDREGRFIGYVAVNRDISLQKAHEIRIQESARRASLLAALSHALAADAQALERVLDHITHAVCASVGDAAAILLLKPDGDTLELVAIHDPDPSHIEHIRANLTASPLRRGESLSGRVVATGEPLVMASIDPEVVRGYLKPEHRARPHLPVYGAMAMPLKVQGQTIGALTVLRFTPGRPYVEEDLHSLTPLTEHAALAIRNAQLHADLTARGQELALAVQELETFAYSVSHDLQTPLQTICLMSEVLQTDLAPFVDAQQAQMLARLGRAGRRMSTLVRSMLDLASVTRGPMHPVPVNLSKLAREIVEELAQRTPGRQVDVIIDEGLWAVGDPALLRTMLVNLLDNAWKFTGATTAARIEVGREPDGAFRVRDNGAGFNPAHAERLFKPFERLHAQTDYPGTGVGLATVQRIVQRHGGQIRADAAPGAGATFRFTLTPPRS